MQPVPTVPSNKLQVKNRVWGSIPQRKATEKLQEVVMGMLAQRHFLETSPNHNSMTLKAWEGERSGEEQHLHKAFRQVSSCLLPNEDIWNTDYSADEWVENLRKGRWDARKEKRRAEEMGWETVEKKIKGRCFESLKTEGFPTEQSYRQQIINNKKPHILYYKKSPYFGPDLCVVITVMSVGALQLIKGCLQPSIFIPDHQPGYTERNITQAGSLPFPSKLSTHVLEPGWAFCW